MRAKNTALSHASFLSQPIGSGYMNSRSFFLFWSVFLYSSLIQATPHTRKESQEQPIPTEPNTPFDRIIIEDQTINPEIQQTYFIDQDEVKLTKNTADTADPTITEAERFKQKSENKNQLNQPNQEEHTNQLNLTPSIQIVHPPFLDTVNTSFSVESSVLPIIVIGSIVASQHEQIFTLLDSLASTTRPSSTSKDEFIEPDPQRKLSDVWLISQWGTTDLSIQPYPHNIKKMITKFSEFNSESITYHYCLGVESDNNHNYNIQDIIMAFTKAFTEALEHNNIKAKLKIWLKPDLIKGEKDPGSFNVEQDIPKTIEKIKNWILEKFPDEENQNSDIFNPYRIVFEPEASGGLNKMNFANAWKGMKDIPKEYSPEIALIGDYQQLFNTQEDDPNLQNYDVILGEIYDYPNAVENSSAYQWRTIIPDTFINSNSDINSERASFILSTAPGTTQKQALENANSVTQAVTAFTEYDWETHLTPTEQIQLGFWHSEGFLGSNTYWPEDELL